MTCQLTEIVILLPRDDSPAIAEQREIPFPVDQAAGEHLPYRLETLAARKTNWHESKFVSTLRQLVSAVIGAPRRTNRNPSEIHARLTELLGVAAFPPRLPRIGW